MTYEQDWYRNMTNRQAEIVKDFEKKGWKIININGHKEVCLKTKTANGVERKARIPR